MNNTFKQLVEKRYSCRNFSSQAIEKEKLEFVLDVVRMAPSACNLQPWQFVVVMQPAMLEKLHECYSRDWFRTAPCCIVALGNHQQAWHRPNDGKDHCDIDLAIAIDHLTLAAADNGLGTCWVCNFDAKKCAEIVELPTHLEVIALMPIGYPAENSIPEKKRNPLNEIVQFID